MNRFTFTILLLTGSLCSPAQGLKEFDIQSFNLGISINEYPDFKKADTVLYEPLSFIVSKNYYVLSDSNNFSFVEIPVRQIVATTSDNGTLISISVIMDFRPDAIERLKNKFGHWQTGSLGQTESSNDAFDISKLSYYLWRFDKNILDAIVTRYQTLSDSMKSNDLIIVSYRTKE